MTKQPVKIFIASSGELAAEREKMVVLLSEINKQFPHLHLEPVKWETDLESGSYGQRVQDAINPLLDTSDIAVFLFFSRAGMFTVEEFDRAKALCQKAFFYFKTGFSPTNSAQFEAFGAVLKLREALEKENTGLFKEFSSPAELENRLRHDLPQYLEKTFPRPAGATATLPELEPDRLADWPLPDSIGYPEHPFLGFERFREQDARIFFGRTDEIRDLLDLLTDRPDRIILLYGQSGAGKSSLLEAGLLPRLRRRGWAVEAHRRNRELGLLHDMETGRAALQHADNAYRLLLLDQVEEMLTNPNPAIENEMNRWAAALADAWRSGFGAQLVLSFRKEYVGEMLDLLQKRHDLPCETFFLHPLTHHGVQQAVAGDSNRRKQYDLPIPPALPQAVAAELSPLPRNPANAAEPGHSAPNTAPLLQITLRKMWDLARATKSALPFDEALYRRVRRDTLEAMLDQQLAEVEQYFAPLPDGQAPDTNHRPLPELHEALRGGLALDVLRQFLTPERTAGSRPLDYLQEHCYPHVAHFRALITALKDHFLLTEDAGAVSHNTRLAHDALAPIVHQRCQTSQLPAQLAWAVVEIKSRHRDGEADFSESDVRIVESGRAFMQRIPDAVHARLEASREAMERRRAELRDKTAFIFDTLANDARTLIATVEHLSALEKIKAAMAVAVPEQVRREQLELLIIETAFFLSATGKHLAKARETLALLASFAYPEKQTVALQNLFRLLPRGHTAFQTFLPAGDFADLEHRYFPQTVFVEGGTFTMGSTEGYDDERPLHEVALSDFRMGATPVTFAQFGLYCAAAGRNIASYAPSWGKWAAHPLVYVSWYEAVEYTNWLSAHLGLQPAYRVDKNQKDPANNSAGDVFKWLVERIEDADGFRLPTEAEWEYAARDCSLSRSFGEGQGGGGSLYAGGNDVDELAWYWKNSGERPLDGEWDYEQIMLNNCRTHPVGQKKPNALGLYDMSGNVWEWCADWFGDNHYEECEKLGLASDPRGPESGDDRVIRGGAWDRVAQDCRVANRYYYAPSRRAHGLGFRLCRSC